MMDEMILNVNTLPYPLHRRIRSDRVRIREENGVFMLTPMAGAEPADKHGMSTEEALRIFRKHAGSINGGIDAKAERLVYLDERYGGID